VRLAAHGWELDLLPALGGAIGALRYQGHDVLRPAPATANSPLDTACFPLLPYANRIAHGRFGFAGREHRLPLNFGDHPHSLHGVGWQTAWNLTALAPDMAVLTHAHAGGVAWPWAYRAEQRFTLAPAEVRVEVSLTNTGGETMPAGLGLHPYFLRDAATRLSFVASELWLADDTMLPTEAVAPERYGDWTSGPAVEGDGLIDNAYAGWPGTARIEQSWGAVEMAATNAPVLHLYRPPAADFFCVEPVGHLPDAINRDGMALLASGMTCTLAMTLRV
jgi:aldose 1-epimerase